jgi:hypothetical protein
MTNISGVMSDIQHTAAAQSIQSKAVEQRALSH